MKMPESDDVGAINNLGVNLSSNKTWFETFLAPYVKFEQVCYSTGGCWHKYGVDATNNTFQFYFDVNGDRKLNIIGKDIYILVYDSDKGLVPAGSDRSKDELKANCETGNGFWCLEYVKDNGWKISDSVWKRTK